MSKLLKLQDSEFTDKGVKDRIESFVDAASLSNPSVEESWVQFEPLEPTFASVIKYLIAEDDPFAGGVDPESQGEKSFEEGNQSSQDSMGLTSSEHLLIVLRFKSFAR